ncbi:MAG TPA: 4'-phosphopantetheinyl transferase [Desulfobacteraceae bacterium]|nr:4'-phosphopantetheinyl transferase [Desulfobacteraceae bacterium]
MIYGIGVDLVSVIRVEKVIQRWGSRFVHRVFTPDEAETCYNRQSSFSAFALRFAAKEAFSKALGTGMRKGLKWRDIEVYNHPSGKPELRLHGKSSEIYRQKGITGIHLSLSDEGEYGIAMVVIEKD